MKFTAGYVLGGCTIIGLGLSAAAGAVGILVDTSCLDDRKEEVANKVVATPTDRAIGDFIRNFLNN